MEINEINPYLRFASPVSFISNGSSVYGLDNRIFLIMEGEASIKVNGENYKMVSGSIFYCAKKIPYYIESSQVISLIALNFDLSQTNTHTTIPYPTVPVSNGDAPTLQSAIISDCDDWLNGCFFLERGDHFKQDIQNIVTEYSRKNVLFGEKCSALLKNLLVDLLREIRLDTKFSSDVISSVISYVDLHYNKSITNKDLAKIAGYHEYYLNRIFKDYTGISLHQYTLDKRINKAKDLILTTELSISEISEHVGFNNPTYFAKYYRSKYKMSPTEFRKKIKKAI